MERLLVRLMTRKGERRMVHRLIICCALVGVVFCSSALFGQEKDIIPHLTVARVKNVKDKSRLSEFMKRHENTHFGTLAISNIKLKKSVLKPSGPVYEDIAVFNLSN